MNTPFHKVWNADLYLDAIGSAAVIVANVLIFLFVAVTAVSALTAGEQIAGSCVTQVVATGDYVDQRPGAPRTSALVECV